MVRYIYLAMKVCLMRMCDSILDYASDVLECLLVAAVYTNKSCRTFVYVYIHLTIELITIY